MRNGWRFFSSTGKCCFRSRNGTTTATRSLARHSEGLKRPPFWILLTSFFSTFSINSGWTSTSIGPTKSGGVTGHWFSPKTFIMLLKMPSSFTRLASKSWYLVFLTIDFLCLTFSGAAFVDASTMFSLLLFPNSTALLLNLNLISPFSLRKSFTLLAFVVWFDTPLLFVLTALVASCEISIGVCLVDVEVPRTCCCWWVFVCVRFGHWRGMLKIEDKNIWWDSSRCWPSSIDAW